MKRIVMVEDNTPKQEVWPAIKDTWLGKLTTGLCAVGLFVLFFVLMGLAWFILEPVIIGTRDWMNSIH
jgi:hypothetical protein